MPLVLVYRGSLPPNGRQEIKHKIRRELHLQISNTIRKPYFQMFHNAPAFREHPVGRFHFHPLICTDPFYPRMGCELEIHALSHDPSSSVLHNGDLDNRLKTLFDALRLPNGERELPPGAEPQEGENPFWVLLSDDRIITDIHIKQDILRTAQESVNAYIELTIRVSVKPGDVA